MWERIGFFALLLVVHVGEKKRSSIWWRVAGFPRELLLVATTYCRRIYLWSP
jgi:hypothetical protein